MINTLIQFASAKIQPSEVGIPTNSADVVVSGVLNTVYFMAGVIAIVVIIVCGILYSTSNGDTSKITRAKDGILYSVIGLVVILLAFAVTTIIVGRF